MLLLSGGTMIETQGPLFQAKLSLLPGSIQHVYTNASTKVSSLIRPKALDVSVDGVPLARCTSLHMAPQRLRRIKATCGLIIPTSSRCDKRVLTFKCLLEMKEEQKSW